MNLQVNGNEERKTENSSTFSCEGNWGCGVIADSLCGQEKTFKSIEHTCHKLGDVHCISSSRGRKRRFGKREKPQENSRKQ